MRSKLLASVAVASFAVVALPHAASAAATMKISGNIETNMSWTEQTLPEKPMNSATSGGLINRLRLQFDPSMTANDLTVGARLRTEAADGTYGYSKAFGYVSGGFGKVTFGRSGTLGYAGNFGEVYGNSGQGMVGPDQASVAGKAFSGLKNPYDDTWAFSGSIDGAMGSYTDAVPGSGNANVLNYETPSIMGLQAGVTYAPKWGTKSDWSNSRSDGDAYTNAVELAVKYGISVSDISINFAAGILAAEAPAGTGVMNDPVARGKLAAASNDATKATKDADGDALPKNVAANLEKYGAAEDAAAALAKYDAEHANYYGKSLKKSLRSYGASLGVSAYDASITLGYTNAGKSGLKNSDMEGQTNLSTTAVSVTLGYNVTKDIAVGGYYGQGYATNADLVSTDKMRQYGVGAEYTVIPGFAVYVAADHVDATNNNVSGSATAKATVGSIGTTINF